MMVSTPSDDLTKICAFQIYQCNNGLKEDEKNQTILKQLASSKSLGGKLLQHEIDSLLEAGKEFFEDVQTVLREHTKTHNGRLAFSGTFLFTPANANEALPVDEKSKPTWISKMTEGKNKGLQSILDHASQNVETEDLRKAPKVEPEPFVKAEPYYPVQNHIPPASIIKPTIKSGLGHQQYHIQGITSRDRRDMCLKCKVYMLRKTPSDGGYAMTCKMCMSKWCLECCDAVRSTGQCTCCLERDCFYPDKQKVDIYKYYTKGRTPSTSDLVPIVPYNNEKEETNSQVQRVLESRRRERSLEHQPKYPKRGKKARTSNHVMTHGDAIGVWSRRYICCGVCNPYEESGIATCKRRTWLGTLSKALTHAQGKHGMKHIRWKQTDTLWACFTNGCSIQNHGTPSFLPMEERTPLSSFILHIAGNDPAKKNTRGVQYKTETPEWEQHAFEHMRTVHGVIQLKTRLEAAPANGVTRIEYDRSFEIDQNSLKTEYYHQPAEDYGEMQFEASETLCSIKREREPAFDGKVVVKLERSFSDSETLSSSPTPSSSPYISGLCLDQGPLKVEMELSSLDYENSFTGENSYSTILV